MLQCHVALAYVHRNVSVGDHVELGTEAGPADAEVRVLPMVPQS